MSVYFTTRHISPHWATPRQSHDGGIPHRPPVTTTITAPSMAPPRSRPANASPSSSQRHLSLDTLARFLHDFHSHYDNTSETDRDTHHNVVRPNFDLVENKTTYAIYGELPGLERNDINVDVNDHLSTVTISGQLKRLAPPTRPDPGASADDIGVVHLGGVGHGGRGNVAEAVAVAVTDDGEEGKELNQDLHWHVTEREVGDFGRAFQFPVETVDMSAVSASVANGILCVLVPKRTTRTNSAETRRVGVS